VDEHQLGPGGHGPEIDLDGGRSGWDLDVGASSGCRSHPPQGVDTKEMTVGRDEGGEAACFAHLVDELRVDDALLGGLVRDLTDPVVIADAAGTIVFWNDAATALFGWRADEAIGRTLDLVVPERFRARHWDGYRRVMATGRTEYAGRVLEVPALHRDGRRLSIAFTVTLLHRPELAAPVGIAAVIRDDTERWEERRRLREAAATGAPGTAGGGRAGPG
jgi:PAS domain S-box-containing protein